MESKKKSVYALLKKYQIFVVLIVVIVILGLINSKFLTLGNFSNIFKQIATNAILAVGMCFVVLTGGIDISVGATLAFVGALSVALTSQGVPIVVVLVISLMVGAGIGMLNGVFISYFRLQPMIVTLAMMSIFRGMTYIFTKGSPISLNLKISGGAIYKWIGSGTIFGAVPFPLILVVIVYAIAYYVLNKTAYGRHVYALGGNEEAAQLSGINTRRAKTIAYVICGVTAAIAGIIISARVASAQPNAGDSYEMDAIAAVVIGGTSLRGGEGHVLYTIVGAIIIGMLNNFLNLMGVDSYYQVVVKGLVILVAVLADAKAGKSKGK